MLLSTIIQLEALENGVLNGATGRAVHGLWFHQWAAVDVDVAEQLHDGHSAQPFTLSPLMDLPRPQHGKTTITPGTPAWFRVTVLSDDLAARLETAWLPVLPETVTPTAFRSAGGHLPFPMPGALINSWLRRWQEFGPVRLPEDLLDGVRDGLVVSAYRLKTVPVREGRRITIGCVGWLTLRATNLNAVGRAAVDLLASYALWCGSGHHTAQGMGMTRCKETGRRGDRGTRRGRD